MTNETYDVAILGGGHNGLTAAAYLARAGLNVIVLEKNVTVGGAAVTEEFAPGFRNSVASYTVSLLNPKVIADLELAKHGLKIIHRPAANFLPVDDSRGLLVPYGLAAQQDAFRDFSERDAARLPAYDAALHQAATVLRDLITLTPPNAGGGIVEMIKGGLAGRKVLKLSLDDQRLLLELFTASASDFLQRWFENETIQALYAFDGNPAISLMAGEGIRWLASSLPIIKADPRNAEAREQALLGAWYCGLCLGSASMALHHKICHVLGGMFNLPHAETHSVMLPHSVKYNSAAAPQAMETIARALGAVDAVAGLSNLKRTLLDEMSLASIGMKEDGIDRAARASTANQYPNPRPVEVAAIRQMIANAYHGAPP